MSAYSVSKDRVHEYWRRPDDGRNRPADYAAVDPERSRGLVEAFRRHIPLDASVLEIGCNVGRNLHYLRQAGYLDLTGIEISPDALEEMARAFPDVREQCKIINVSIEEALKELPSFDVIFTMAVLVHIHPESDWIFPEIASRAKHTLIIIEQETSASWRHFGRRYRPIFEKCGFTQVERKQPMPSLPKDYALRVFRRSEEAAKLTALQSARDWLYRAIGKG